MAKEYEYNLHKGQTSSLVTTASTLLKNKKSAKESTENIDSLNDSVKQASEHIGNLNNSTKDIVKNFDTLAESMKSLISSFASASSTFEKGATKRAGRILDDDEPVVTNVRRRSGGKAESTKKEPESDEVIKAKAELLDLKEKVRTRYRKAKLSMDEEMSILSPFYADVKIMKDKIIELKKITGEHAKWQEEVAETKQIKLLGEIHEGLVGVKDTVKEHWKSLTETFLGPFHKYAVLVWKFLKHPLESIKSIFTAARNIYKIVFDRVKGVFGFFKSIGGWFSNKLSISKWIRGLTTGINMKTPRLPAGSENAPVEPEERLAGITTGTPVGKEPAKPVVEAKVLNDFDKISDSSIKSEETSSKIHNELSDIHKTIKKGLKIYEDYTDDQLEEQQLKKGDHLSLKSMLGGGVANIAEMLGLGLLLKGKGSGGAGKLGLLKRLIGPWGTGGSLAAGAVAGGYETYKDWKPSQEKYGKGLGKANAVARGAITGSLTTIGTSIGGPILGIAMGYVGDKIGKWSNDFGEWLGLKIFDIKDSVEDILKSALKELLSFGGAAKTFIVNSGKTVVHTAQQVTHSAQKTTSYLLTSAKDIVKKASGKYGVPPERINAIINAESSGKANALSPKGAQGMMQLMPGTAKGLGVTDPNDPEQNIMAGTKYYAQLLKQYNGDETKALAAYNWGSGNLDKYGLENAPAETQAYIKKVQAGIPQAQKGGHVDKTGLAVIHKDENVTPSKSTVEMNKLLKSINDNLVAFIKTQKKSDPHMHGMNSDMIPNMPSDMSMFLLNYFG